MCAGLALGQGLCPPIFQGWDPAKDKSLEPLSEGWFRRGAARTVTKASLAPLLNHPLNKDFKGSAFNGGPGGRAPWPSAGPAHTSSIFAHQGDQAALDFDAVWREEPGFVAGVGGFQGDGVAAFAESFERDFVFVDQGDDDLAGFGDFAFADDHGVAVQDAGVDHGVACDFEGEMVAGAEHGHGHFDLCAIVAQRFDGLAGGDAAVEGQLHGRGFVGGAHTGQAIGEIAAYDVGRELRGGGGGRFCGVALGGGLGEVFGQAHHL